MFGNCILFGGNDDQELIRNAISDAIDIGIDAIGAKKALSEVLKADTLQKNIWWHACP